MVNPPPYRVARTTAIEDDQVVFQLRVYDESLGGVDDEVLKLSLPDRVRQEQARLQLQDLLTRVDVAEAAQQIDLD